MLLLRQFQGGPVLLPSSLVPYIALRGYESHSWDHAKHVNRGQPADKPEKPRITIPVPVQNRAVKRHRNPKVMMKEQDKQKLKTKPVVIAGKNKDLDHRQSQTYGKFAKVPLISAGWYHRKSVGDFFTINPFQPQQSTAFSKQLQASPTFSDYNLDPRIVKALSTCGFTKSTNIQHEAIPALLEHEGSNALIAAETGNGKTLAFLVPMLNRILALKDIEETQQDNAPYGLVVVPGRELADQIGAAAEDLCYSLGLRVRVLKGGQVRQQILKGERSPVDLVVGSLGGLSKLVHEGYIKRDRAAVIALDEIDTLLDDTFKDGLLRFIRQFGAGGQSLVTGVNILMSGATFPTNFATYLDRVMDTDDILRVSTQNLHRMLFHIPQKFLRVSAGKKTETLLELLEKDISKKKKVVIFSNKASTADFLQMFLKERNIECINFTGALHYKYRRETLDRFLSGEVNLMSCTDLVSRGIDTSTVSHVINYDFPLNPADYIHRVGRVGRVMGMADGHVTSLVCNAGQALVLQNLETAVRKNIEISKVNNNIIRIIEHRAYKYNDSL